MTVTVEIDTNIDIQEKVKNIVQDPGKYKVIFIFHAIIYMVRLF